MDEVVVVDLGLASDAAIETKDASNTDDQVDNDLVESIWNNLDGTVERETIKRAIVEAEAKYKHAQVKTYVPILMRRFIMQSLK
jgi:hypothetical protein